MAVDFRLLAGIPDIADKVRQEQAANADRAQRERAIQSQAAVDRERTAATSRNAELDRALRQSEAEDAKLFKGIAANQAERRLGHDIHQDERNFVQKAKEFDLTFGLDITKYKTDTDIKYKDLGLKEKRLELDTKLGFGNLEVNQQNALSNRMTADLGIRKYEDERTDSEAFKRDMLAATKSGNNQAILDVIAKHNPKESVQAMNTISILQERTANMKTAAELKENQEIQETLVGFFKATEGMDPQYRTELFNNVVEGINIDYDLDIPKATSPQEMNFTAGSIMAIKTNATKNMLDNVRKYPTEQNKKILANIYDPEVQKNALNNINAYTGKKSSSPIGKVLDDRDSIMQQIESNRRQGLPTAQLDYKLRLINDSIEAENVKNVSPEIEAKRQDPFYAYSQTPEGKELTEQVNAAIEEQQRIPLINAALDKLIGSPYAPRPGEDIYNAVGNWLNNPVSRAEREAAAILNSEITQGAILLTKAAKLTPVSDNDTKLVTKILGKGTSIDGIRAIYKARQALNQRKIFEQEYMEYAINIRRMNRTEARASFRHWAMNHDIFDANGDVIVDNIGHFGSDGTQLGGEYR